MVAFNGIVMGAFQSCYISYRLDKEEVNKGLMTEAIAKGSDTIVNNSNRRSNLYNLCIVFIDIFIVLFSIYISYLLRFDFTPPLFNFQPFIDNAIYIIILYLIFMYMFGLFDELNQSFNEIIYSIFLTVSLLFISTMAITFFMRGFSYPRTVLFISSVVQFLLLSIWRIGVLKFKHKIYGKKSVLIISDSNSDSIARKMLVKHNDIYSIKYICDSFSKNIEIYIDTVDIIVLCDDLTSDFKNFIIDKCLINQKNIFVVPVMSDMAFLGSKLNKIDDVPILELKPLMFSVEQKLVKRVLDIIVAGIMFIIASPIMLIVAICIKITDMGPVFYKQERVTEGGKLFKILKFRSMIHNAENNTGPVLASENDERITKVGKVIRAMRIDELPQLINIIKGEMSIVGPRPERPFYVDKFEKQISDYKYRTLVKAGLTGLAQIFGKYNTKPEDKTKYDIFYIKNYSILLDFKLILQTIRIIFIKESTEGLKNEIGLDIISEDKETKIIIDKKIDKI